MSDIAATTPRLDIGRVVARAFAIIRQRWATLAVFFAGYFAIEAAGLFAPVRYEAGRHDAQLGISIALFLAFEVLIWLRDLALIATALQTTRERLMASIAGAARSALRVFPTLAPFFVFSELPRLVETLWRRWSGAHGLASAQMYQVLLLTGFTELAFALVVTGCWGVAAPVALVEAGGLWASMARAWRLLSGSRWRLVAIYVVVTVVGAVPGLLAAALTLPFESALAASGHGASVIRTEFAIAGALGAIVTATWRVMVAAAYLELRRVRDGVALGDVAEVFA